MVLTHTTNDFYSHPFPTVTLAYFLRYCSPQLNPFARHVLSTDTISSHVDSETGRLHTTRIHLKKSRLPKAVLKLLPTSVTGGMTDKASYILETSVIDMREGWMRSESRNLNYTGILSVVEQQVYTAAPAEAQGPVTASAAAAAAAAAGGTTGVETTVIFRSRLGERIRERFEKGHHRYQQQIQQLKQQAQQHVQQTQQSNADEPRSGWFSTGWVSDLGAKGVQRSIELMASTKTQDQLGKSREGMRMILERLRQTGIIGVLELRRRAMEGNLEAIEI